MSAHFAPGPAVCRTVLAVRRSVRCTRSCVLSRSGYWFDTVVTHLIDNISPCRIVQRCLCCRHTKPKVPMHCCSPLEPGIPVSLASLPLVQLQVQPCSIASCAPRYDSASYAKLPNPPSQHAAVHQQAAAGGDEDGDANRRAAGRSRQHRRQLRSPRPRRRLINTLLTRVRCNAAAWRGQSCALRLLLSGVDCHGASASGNSTRATRLSLLLVWLLLRALLVGTPLLRVLLARATAGRIAVRRCQDDLHRLRTGNPCGAAGCRWLCSWLCCFTATAGGLSAAIGALARRCCGRRCCSLSPPSCWGQIAAVDTDAADSTDSCCRWRIPAAARAGAVALTSGGP